MRASVIRSRPSRRPARRDGRARRFLAIKKIRLLESASVVSDADAVPRPRLSDHTVYQRVSTSERMKQLAHATLGYATRRDRGVGDGLARRRRREQFPRERGRGRARADDASERRASARHPRARGDGRARHRGRRARRRGGDVLGASRRRRRRRGGADPTATRTRAERDGTDPRQDPRLQKLGPRLRPRRVHGRARRWRRSSRS